MAEVIKAVNTMLLSYDFTFDVRLNTGDDFTWCRSEPGFRHH